MATIDLNADLGESFGHWRLGDDAALLPLISSANVACGFHGGDPSTIQQTVRSAAETGVRVGAQVSYPDLGGFGRRYMDVEAADLTADVIYQIGALAGFCRASGIELAFVKPHGALYNRIVDDERQASAVVQALCDYGGLPLVTLPRCVAAEVAAARGVRVVVEAFADRAYTRDGRLVSRREPGAVLTDPDVVAERVVRLATAGELTTQDGSTVSLTAETVCLHGDTPGAVEMARRVRAALEAVGVTVAPWQ